MSRSILYVEDNPDAVAFFSRIVSKLGDYNYRTPADGISALKLLEEDSDFEPQMILLDINLPGMNGFEILQSLRAIPNYKNTPVIMFTSSDSSVDVQKSYEFGANAYLVKPDSLQNLKDVLQDTFNFWLKRNVA